MTTPRAALPSRSRRRYALAAALLPVLALLGGCMKMEMTLVLAEDDTASGSMVMAVSDEAAETMGMDPQELWDSMSAEVAGDVPAGATAEPYKADGYTGMTYSFAATPLAEFATAQDGSLTVVREGDEYVVAGTMDLTDASMDAEQLEDPTTQAILATFVVRMSVTFPGPVSDHNGTLDGTTVTWQPAFNEVTTMSARGSAVAGAPAPQETAEPQDTASTAAPTAAAKPGATSGADLDVTDEDAGGLPGWLLPVLGGLLLLAVAGGVTAVVLTRRRSAAAAPVAAGWAGGVPPGAQPGQPWQAPPAPQGPPPPQGWQAPPAPQGWQAPAVPQAPPTPPVPPAQPGQSTPPPPPPW